MTKTDPDSYNYLISLFGEEKLRNRFLFLHGKGREYLKAAELEEFAAVNEFLVDEILLDFFSDIARLKDFHLIEKTNPKKVAAYTAFWICRRKPLQLVKNVSNKDIIRMPQLKWLNENFSISVLISMAFDAKSPIVNGSWAKYNSFLRHLRYHLTFRHMDAQALELLLVALESESIYTPI